MGELIKIKEENGKQLVSARELYDGLGMDRKNWSKWHSRNIEGNEYFLENNDWIKVVMSTTSKTGQTQTDFAISLEFAKHLAMMSKTEKSHEYRNYFIACENKLKEVNLKGNLLLAIYNGGQDAVVASKKLTEIEVKEATQPLLQKIENDKPLVEFGEQILKSNDNILIRELAKIISDEVRTIGQNRLYEKLRDWGYIMKNKTEPYQKYIDNGYFVLEEKTINTPYGRKITKTCKVTPKGQIAIVEKFRKELNSIS